VETISQQKSIKQEIAARGASKRDPRYGDKTFERLGIHATSLRQVSYLSKRQPRSQNLTIFARHLSVAPHPRRRTRPQRRLVAGDPTAPEHHISHTSALTHVFNMGFAHLYLFLCWVSTGLQKTRAKAEPRWYCLE